MTNEERRLHVLEYWILTLAYTKYTDHTISSTAWFDSLSKTELALYRAPMHVKYYRETTKP